jgi:hypothetical protein
MVSTGLPRLLLRRSITSSALATNVNLFMTRRHSSATMMLRRVPRRTLQVHRHLSSVKHAPPDVSPKMGMIIFGTATTILFGLGVWQSQRYVWKVGLIESEKRAMSVTPIKPPPGLTQANFCEWASKIPGERITLTGSYIHSGEVLLGPRAGHPGVKGSTGAGMATSPQGYFVITPFRLLNG